MKKVILTGAFLLVVFWNLPLEAQWAKSYGKPNTGGHIPDYIQQCRDGGYVIVGFFWAGVDRSYDAYILKLNSRGEIEWQYAYGTDGWDGFSHVQQTSDDGYIIAGEQGGYFPGGIIVKLNWQGGVEWARDYRISYLNFVKETTDGGYIASGKGYVLRLDSKGHVIWDFRYGYWAYENPFQPTSDGGYIFANLTYPNYYRVTKLTPSGSIEWQKSYGGAGWNDVDSTQPIQILQTLEGDYIVMGTGYRSDFQDSVIWVFKLGSEGNIKWQKTYGGSGNCIARSALLANGGGYLVAFDIDSKFSIMKLSQKGSVKWIRTYNIGYGNFGRLYWRHAFQATKDGGYITTPSSGGNYFTLLKLLSDCMISQSCFFMGSSNVSVSKTDVVPLKEFEAPVTHGIKSGNIGIPFRNLDFSVWPLCRAESKYTLRIRSQPGGSTNPYPGKYIYYGGKEIELTAKPGADNRFIGWSGDVPEGQEKRKSITLIMNSNKKVEAEFLVTAPKRPKGLMAEALSWNRVKLIWKDMSKNEKGFEIERRIKGENNWGKIAEVKANRKSYRDQKLQPNTAYQYRVRAFNQSGFSAYSNKATVWTKEKN